MWFEILKGDWLEEALPIMEKLLKDLKPLSPSLYLVSPNSSIPASNRIGPDNSQVGIYDDDWQFYVENHRNSPPNKMTLDIPLIDEYGHIRRSDWLKFEDITPEEIIDKLKVQFDKIKANSPDEKAKQLVIKIANELDYVKIYGDRIHIQPDWLKDSPKSHEHHRYGYSFYLSDIAPGNVMCIYVGDRDGSSLCLNKKFFDEIPIGDAYITVMLMASTEEQWTSLWTTYGE
jgi:hypothetical protein